jgi:hypothetical protein
VIDDQLPVLYARRRLTTLHAFSVRSRDNSICAGVTTLGPAPLNLPASVTSTLLRSVWSTLN